MSNFNAFLKKLFNDKEKYKFIVGFRGTETDNFIGSDIAQDITLSLNGNIQSSPLLEFLEQVDKINEAKEVNEFNDSFKKFFLTETIKILNKLSYNRITYYIRSDFANSYLF
ncbi:hypothetical protein [Campylobacter cuniculorum]|uniref:hypothetical protein n=1 Tax=Campylobacter cuniculorum TaxID=374106 RepID=UPI001E399EDE|nr:hypothetical protein [Campylobacter cuniculorum]